MQHSLKHLFASFSHWNSTLPIGLWGDFTGYFCGTENRTKIHLKCTSLVPYQTLHQCEQELAQALQLKRVDPS